MTPDLTICRTHNRQTEGDRCPSFLVSRIGECVIVRLVWSADGHALLEVEPCQDCVEDYGQGLAYDCGECDEGWRYKDEPIDDPWSDKPGAKVAVVPLKDDA